MLPFILATAAWAVDPAVSVELGSLENHDPAFDLYATPDAMPSRGLSGSFPLHDRFGVVAGWQHSHRGAELWADEQWLGVVSFKADTFSVGARADLALGPHFRPYVDLSGLLVRGVARYDDDPSDPASPGQVKAAGLTGGASALGGLAFRLGPETLNAPIGASISVAMGYSYVGTLTLGGFGSMRPGGLTSRAGLSLLF